MAFQVHVNLPRLTFKTPRSLRDLDDLWHANIRRQQTENVKVLALLDQLEALTGHRPVLECINYLPVEGHKR